MVTGRVFIISSTRLPSNAVAQPQGRFTFYQLSDPRVASFLALADELLKDVARGIYECTRYTAEDFSGKFHTLVVSSPAAKAERKEVAR